MWCEDGTHSFIHSFIHLQQNMMFKPKVCEEAILRPHQI